MKALEAYLGPPTDGEITARLHEVYADIPSTPDPALLVAQRDAIGEM